MHRYAGNRPRYPRRNRPTIRWRNIVLCLLLFGAAVFGVIRLFQSDTESSQESVQTKNATQPKPRTVFRQSATTGGGSQIIIERPIPRDEDISAAAPKTGGITLLRAFASREVPNTVTRLTADAARASQQAARQPRNADQLLMPDSGAVTALSKALVTELPKIIIKLSLPSAGISPPLSANATDALTVVIKQGGISMLVEQLPAISSLAEKVITAPAKQPQQGTPQRPDEKRATLAPSSANGDVVVEKHGAVTQVIQTQTIDLPRIIAAAIQQEKAASPLKTALNDLRPKNAATSQLPAETVAAPSLTPPVDNMWGQPFVGYSLKEISKLLTERYAGEQATEWGEKLPGIITILDPTKYPDARAAVVALTLDACDGKQGSSYDEELIAFLRQNSIPATIFVTSKWIKANRKTFRELSDDPLFEIAAHGVAHKPASVSGKTAFGIKGTASMLELVNEVEGNLREIQRTSSRRPAWYRSGTAHYDTVAVKAIHDLGVHIAGYSIAADEGASLPADVVAKRVLGAKHRDIILVHMNHPKSGTRDGLKEALPQLIQKGYTFVTLSGS